MDHSHMNACDWCLEYISGELDDQEQVEFEKHLQSCESCGEEVSRLNEVWSMLPLSVEEVEVPADLKEQVLESVFREGPAQRRGARSSFRGKWWKRSFSAAVAAAVLAVSIWNYSLYLDRSGADSRLAAPVQIEKIYTLHSFAPEMKTANGSGWVVKHGDSLELVVQLSGLLKTEGEQAYQVWLIHDGVRQNAGTLRADHQGNGVLTYRLSGTDQVFEAIGITLEPDSHGTRPRGKKVLGT